MDNAAYSDKVMEHFRNPRNVGEIPDADGIGNVGNPVCGDVLRLYLKIEDNVIVDAKFKTFGCLPPQEKINLGDGKWFSISDITKRQKVLNHLGEITNVAQVYRDFYRGKLLEITPFVSPHNSFQVTPNHPILSIKRKWLKSSRRSSSLCDWLRTNKEELFSKKPDYVQARNLEKGDYLIYSYPKQINNDSSFTDDLMRLLGYYASEGYVVAKDAVIAFAFNKNETQLIKEVCDLLSRIVGKIPKKRIRNNVAEVYACSREWARFFIKQVGKGARKKFLSDEIMNLPFEKQELLVETFLLSDGDKYRRREKDSETFRMTTASEVLAVQLQQILARGGIFASIKQVKKVGCRIEGRLLKDSIMYILTFKKDRRHKFVHKNGKHFLVPIRSVKLNKYSGKVHNFQVWPEPNSYLVRGFAVHNCGAAIATSSMVTELVKGKTVDEALKISNRAVAEALGGLPPIKMHCSVLAEDALKAAIKDYKEKQAKK